MSDAYLNDATESVDTKIFDVRAEYDWWIENGCTHAEALKNAKDAEEIAHQRYKVKEQINARD